MCVGQQETSWVMLCSFLVLVEVCYRVSILTMVVPGRFLETVLEENSILMVYLVGECENQHPTVRSKHHQTSKHLT